MHVPINLYDGRILIGEHNTKDSGENHLKSMPYYIISVLNEYYFLNPNLDQISIFLGSRLRDISRGGLSSPFRSYLGPSSICSSFEEITYHEVREETVERRPSGGRKILVPITVLGSNQDLTSSPDRSDKVAQENETIKPLSRKLTYTVPVVKDENCKTPQLKVFPPKSPKKIQFDDGGRRSSYVFSTQNIIKDQSKPTPPDVDNDEPGYLAQSKTKAKNSYLEHLEKPLNGSRIHGDYQDETDRSIKKTSGPTKVNSIILYRSIRKSHQTFLFMGTLEILPTI